MGPRFPFIRFGKCPVCEGEKEDQDAANADVSSRDTATRGSLLFMYQGQLMCRLCIKQQKAYEESLLSADKHADAERFRATAGFKRRIS